MFFFLIIRAPPRDMEFPKRQPSATKGVDSTDQIGPHRCVKAAVWTTN